MVLCLPLLSLTCMDNDQEDDNQEEVFVPGVERQAQLQCVNVAALELLAIFSELQKNHQNDYIKTVADDMVTAQDALKLFEVKLNDTEAVEFSIVDEYEPNQF